MATILDFIGAASGVVAKALTRNDGNGSQGVISDYMPGALHNYGQPRQGTQSDAYGLITPARMREVILKTPTAGAAINAILDYSSGVVVKVRNADPAKIAPVRASKYVADLLDNPNPQDDEREFRRKVLRDLLILGYAAVEIEEGNDASGLVANLYVLDAGNLRVDFDKHGNILGYNQLDVYGQPIPGRDGVHTFLPEQVIFYQLDPRSESQYPMSRVMQLYACAVIEQLMLSYIGARFTDGNIPFGVLDIGDITEDELEAAIALWNQQIEEMDRPDHRLIMTGSKGGAKWIQFGNTLAELEAPMLLSAIRNYILGILGVTVNELGESDSVNKSNGFNLSYTFKKRAIEPLLDVFVGKTTYALLRRTLHYNDLELYYEDIDSRDELLQAQIDDVYLKTGAISINFVRNRKGQPSIPGGEEPTVDTGAAKIPVSMVREFAEVQLEALKLAVLQSQVSIMSSVQQMQQPQIGPDGKPVPGTGQIDMGQPITSLPLQRMIQPPERFTTPDASGSSSFKFNLPAPKPPNTNKPRGPVEKAKTVGARKENMGG